MRFMFSAASIAALLAFATTTIFASDMSLAANAAPIAATTDIAPPRLPLVLPAGDETPAIAETAEPTPRAETAESLAALVAQRLAAPESALDTETRCLAAAIFYEARSESLAGKLAVARVVINRSRSGRFPTSLCGVVTQPGQFSFVRGGQIPAVAPSARGWPDSLAIARIAQEGGWVSEAEGALFFHARRVAPGWARQRLASVDNHIFYR